MKTGRGETLMGERTRLILIGAVLSALALAQSALAAAAASRTKTGVVLSVAATRTGTAQPVVTRTMTGRPVDLDPRIPWLEDMGEPQSGGPEPFVVEMRMRYPLKGEPESVAEHGDRLAVVNYHYVTTPGSTKFHLVLLTRTGQIRWSRTLSRGGVPAVFWEGNRIYVIPQGTSRSATPTALVYDEDGVLIRSAVCPLKWPERFAPGEFGVFQGTAIWERKDGSRVSLRLGDSPPVDPDSVLLPSDLSSDDGENGSLVAKGKLRIIPDLFSYDMVDTKRKYLAPGAKERRAKRVKGWAGRELDRNELDRLRAGRNGSAGSNGRTETPGSGGWSYVPWGSPGEVLSFFTIINPLGLSKEKLFPEDEKRTGIHPLFERSLVVRFDGHGRLRGYLILVGMHASGIFIQPQSIYEPRYERDGSVWLTRWVVAQKP